MNWDAVKAGYGLAILIMLPFFIAIVWALKAERHGVAIFLMFGWLIFGNVAFLKAHDKKRSDRSDKPSH